MERPENLQYKIVVSYATPGLDAVSEVENTAEFRAALFSDAVEKLLIFYRDHPGGYSQAHIYHETILT